jgi:RHS repeat-associated protein
MKDHLGSTRVVVDRKDGSVQETRSYDPLGELMPDYCSQKAGTNTKTQEMYSGKELDNDGSSIGVSDLNLYYYGARYYDPEIGQWTTRDPIEDENLGVNPYRFVNNNPLSWVDPWPDE